jgi:hypothetical protein
MPSPPPTTSAVGAHADLPPQAVVGGVAPRPGLAAGPAQPCRRSPGLPQRRAAARPPLRPGARSANGATVGAVSSTWPEARGCARRGPGPPSRSGGRRGRRANSSRVHALGHGVARPRAATGPPRCTSLVSLPTEMRSTPVAAMRADAVQVHPARHFQHGAAGVQRVGAVHVVQRKVVQQHAGRAGLPGLRCSSARTFHLDLDAHAGVQRKARPAARA